MCIEEERNEQQKKTYPDQPQEIEQPQPQKVRRTEELDPKLQAWMQRNPWFGTDAAMTGAAQGIHQQIVGSEGFDPSSDEYYSEIDKRMRENFPHKFQEKRANVQAVTPASNGRTVKSGRKKTVQLTPGQVAFANKMNIPLERYAKEVAKIENRRS